MALDNDSTDRATGEVMALPEVAAYFHCELSKVMELARAGELRGAKIGKQWVFRREDVRAYLANEIERQTTARRPAIERVSGLTPIGTVVFPPLPARKRGRKRIPLPSLTPPITERD